MTHVSSISVAAARPTVDYRGPIVVALIITGLLTWVFWDFLSRQVRWAFMMPADWGHTIVIPCIAGYFIYLQRDKLKRVPFRTTWIAFIPVVLGIAWYMLCVFGPQVLWHHNLRGAGFSLTLFGVVLLFFGWRAMMVLWFPLAYLVVFGQTISDRLLEIVTFELQSITARGATVLMQMIGMDVDRQGNTIFLWEAGRSEPLPLNIAEACSGMRMLMAFLALGVAIAYTGLSRFWQRTTLVLLAVPTAVAVNILRVVTLAQLSRIDPDFTAGEFHTFVGLVWLVPAFLIYLGLVWIIRHIVVEPSNHPQAAGATGDAPATGPGPTTAPEKGRDD